MRILLTGAGGQLGSEVKRWSRGTAHELVPMAREQLDVTRRADVLACVRRIGPQLIINASAYTAVDLAEQAPAAAMAVNAEAPGWLAEAAVATGAALFHVSTDYVFDGRAREPYGTCEPVAPLGIYGRSKWQGEVAIREILPAHLILRVSWLFGVTGKNFVTTLVRLARERDSLRVVADQFGCPTPARSLALFLLELADRYRDATALPWGTYHYRGCPETSWHGFAAEILERVRARSGARAVEVIPITTAEYPTLARRPSYSVLDCRLTTERFGIALPDWRPELDRVISEITQARPDAEPQSPPLPGTVPETRNAD